MNVFISAIGKEISKDKWLCFLLIMVLLFAFIRTSNDALEQLLVTAVGGFLGLMRAGTTQNIASGEGSVVKTEEPKP